MGQGELCAADRMVATTIVIQAIRALIIHMVAIIIVIQVITVPIIHMVATIIVILVIQVPIHMVVLITVAEASDNPVILDNSNAIGYT